MQLCLRSRVLLMKDNLFSVAGRAVCEPNYPCSQKCDIVDNQVKCSCYPGFKLASDQANCEGK